jgi:SAM-dependent methyltransferase
VRNYDNEAGSDTKNVNHDELKENGNMSQTTTGLRAVLSSPWIYNAFQNMMGARSVRRSFSETYIRGWSGCRLLDIGCGTAWILEYLPDDMDYRGYDIDPDYIAAARVKFGQRGQFACRLLEEPEVRELPPFDIVISVGLLHHLDDAAARKVLRLAKIALKPSGRFVSLDPVFAAGQNPIARFIISQDRGRNVRDGEGYLALARHEFNMVKGSLHHRAWIPYTHWIMECTRE